LTNFCGEKTGVKVSKQSVVVIDADALIAQTDSNDALHQIAVAITQELDRKNTKFIYPVTAVYEAATHMQRVLNNSSSAYGIIQLLSNSEFEVVEVNQKTLFNALKFFDPKSSKKNTIFDCTVALIAKEKGADAIFSFDKFYKKLGFKLASELLRE